MGCGTGLGYFGEGYLVLRERAGKVTLDIKGAVSVERRCSNCETVNELNQIIQYRKRKTSHSS